MPDTPELIPNENEYATLLFENEEDYIRFREEFIDEVIPLQEEWREAHRRSEEESRQRKKQPAHASEHLPTTSIQIAAAPDVVVNVATSSTTEK